MSGINDFQTAKLKFQHEIDLQNKLLADEKVKLKKLEDEATEIKQKSELAQKTIEAGKVRMAENEREKKTLENKTRTMEMDLKRRHSEIEQLAEQNRQELAKHGVNAPHHF